MDKVFLQCTSGSLSGNTFILEGGPVFIFGRYNKATINLSSDPSASQLHFLIDTSDNRVRAIDIGSTNGLVINDTLYGGKFGKPPTEFITLKDGDIIIAGGNQFRLGIGEAPSGATPVYSGGRHVAEGETRKSVVESSSIFPDIEGYRILERIGTGGRGAVYKAQDLTANSQVAIKIMLTRTLKKRRALDSFKREIQITKQLDHPNIIRYLADGIAGERPYLVLEYANGGNLDQYIRKTPEKRLAFADAIPLFLQILEAVAYMHGRSLVHKDVKPKNILLDIQPETNIVTKLSDMGLSSRMANSYDSFMPAVNEGGTPAYMPPEQLTDITKALPQSDVFSSAATMYQMLSGKLLYDFKDKDQVTTILDGNIIPILTLCPDLPGRFAEVINKSLSYYPENRYADAGEMLKAVKKSLK